MQKFHWLLGLDMSPTAFGALRFARWLDRRAPGHHTTQGIYAVETVWGADGEPVAVGADMSPIEETLRTFVDQQGLAGALTSVEACHGSPDATLAALAMKRKADGIIIGRARGTDSRALVSLGAVPRRLLRRSDVPVIIVPPDAPRDAFGPGPIIVAVSPTRDSVAAVEFGLRMAQEHGLELKLVHVLPARSDDHALHRGRRERSPAADRRRTTIDRWCEGHAMPTPTVEVLRGRVCPEVLGYGRRVDASMVVCGSRGTSLLQRIFNSSTSSRIAADCDRPVAVVPGFQ